MGWAVCVDPLWNVYGEYVVNVGCAPVWVVDGL